MNDIAEFGALVGQPARATMLLSLLDGRGRTAGELAEEAGVTPQTASHHLAQLMAGQLLRVDRQGRHRYFRLAAPEIAELLDSVRVVAAAPTAPSRPFGPRPTAMRQARMCYDHMAGELGIGVVDSLVASGVLIEAGDNFQLTDDGERLLDEFGVDVAAARRRRRHFARTCLDWSERRPHLAGALGAALADRLFELEWVERDPEGRTLFVTPTGQRGLADTFGVDVRLNKVM